MKKILIIFLIAFSAAPAFAKKKAAHMPPSFCLRAGLGYATAVAGGDAMVYDAHLQPISGTQLYDGTYDTYNLKKASFSSGFGTVIAPGLMINEHIGVEVAAGFGLAMKKYTLHYTSTATGSSFTDNFSSYANMPVILMPALIVSTGCNNNLSAYARVGLALPVSGKIVTNETYTDNIGTITTTFEVKSHFSLGLCGAAGARYNLNRHMGLWVELNGLAMSLNSKSGTYTSYIQDGQQVLGAINTSDTHFLYTKNYSERNNNDPNQATKATAFSAPFNNLGISVGILFNL